MGSSHRCLHSARSIKELKAYLRTLSVLLFGRGSKGRQKIAVLNGKIKA